MSDELHIETEGGAIRFSDDSWKPRPVLQLSAGIEPDLFFVVEVETLALRLTINRPPSRLARFVLRRLGIVWSPFTP